MSCCSDVVIPRVRRLCPWAKLLVMLRDPVRRAYSQYQMFIDTSGSQEQNRIRSSSASSLVDRPT